MAHDKPKSGASDGHPVATAMNGPAGRKGETSSAAPDASSQLRTESIRRVMERIAPDLDRLAEYDRGSLALSDETPASVALDLSEVDAVVAALRARYPADARLGLLKDGSLDGVLGQIEQSFMGEALYGSAEEKAANLLYMVVKDHPFHDGNKRTAAALFAYYLERNHVDLGRAIPGNMLSALTLIAASGDASKKDETVALIRSLLESR